MMTTVGIDVGSISTKVVLGPSKGCEIVRSEGGSHTTPTAISFSETDGGRMIGETANLKASTTLVHLNRLLVPGVLSNDKKDDDDDEEDDSFQSFYRFGISSYDTEKGVLVNIPCWNKGEATTTTTTTYDAAAVLAMLLGKIRKNVNATLKRLASADSSANDDNDNHHTTARRDTTVKYVLSLPPGSTKQAIQVMKDAAYAAGLGTNVQIVNSAACLATAYKRKFPEGRFGSTPSDTSSTDNGDKTEKEKKKKVTPNATLVVDMGHAQTNVTVFKLSSEAEPQQEEDDTNNDDSDTQKETHHKDVGRRRRPMEIVASACHQSLGAGSVDIQLWKYFTSTLPAFAAGCTTTIEPSSKNGQRLLDACQKLKHLLSQLPEGKVTVENIVHDQDVPMSCTRSTLVELCQSEQSALSTLIEGTLNEAAMEYENENGNGDGDDGPTPMVIDSIEILGGGCRIPMFQNVIHQALKNSNVILMGSSSSSNSSKEEMTLSRSLDDTSVALGAAVLGDTSTTTLDNNTQPWVRMKNVPLTTTSFFENDNSSSSPPDRDEYRQQLFHEEERMAAVDEEIARKGEIRNKMEAHVLEMRSAKYGKHASLLPDGTVLDEHLQEVDDWLFSEESDNATLQDIQSKLDSTVAKTNDMCSTYLQAVKDEEDAKDREMEAEAQQAQAEAAAAAAAAGGGDEEEAEDHDNRRLPKKRRMEIVMKNKSEANELFSDGNYRHAAARYTKALTHCAKFVDLNPDDLEEVKGVKLSLNLNLALAYFKLEKLEQSLRVCNEALELDDKSVKALYRRATVFYEKKRWDDATKDLKKALDVAPEDKAIKKLQQKVDLQVKRQKAKEKKMAQKMFG